MTETVIWPAYLDSSKSRGQGRRVPEDVGVDSPDAKEIAKAVKQVGYDFEYEADKRYPKSWWEDTGRVTVDADDSKDDVLRAVAAYLDAMRGEQ